MNAIVPSSHLPEPDRVWLRMVRLNGQMADVIAKALREIDLSIPQCDVLSILIDREGSSQQDLAERLYVTKGNISGLIDRLTIAGLVERRAIEEDRRAHAIHLTVKGRALALRYGTMQLARNDGFGLAGIALGLGFANAQDHRQASGQRRLGLGAHGGVIFCMDGAAFAMPDDHKARARIKQHRGRHIAGKGATRLGMAILAADGAILRRLGHGVNEGEWRGQTDIDRRIAGRGTVDGARFRHSGAQAVHLPIADDIGP